MPMGLQTMQTIIAFTFSFVGVTQCSFVFQRLDYNTQKDTFDELAVAADGENLAGRIEDMIGTN